MTRHIRRFVLLVALIVALGAPPLAFAAPVKLYCKGVAYSVVVIDDEQRSVDFPEARTRDASLRIVVAKYDVNEIGVSVYTSNSTVDTGVYINRLTGYISADSREVLADGRERETRNSFLQGTCTRAEPKF